MPGQFFLLRLIGGCGAACPGSAKAIKKMKRDDGEGDKEEDDGLEGEESEPDDLDMGEGSESEKDM